MGIANGLTIPNNIANGNALDAPTAMANWNGLLVALNRALLDGGNGNGMNASGSQIHNLAAGTASTDAVNLGQLSSYLPLNGGTQNVLGYTFFVGGANAPTPTTGDNSGNLATTAFVQAQLAATLASYAPVASPAFTGAPTAPAPAAADNSTRIATTAWATANIGGLGQTTQNVTSTRTLGTTYTNTTGREIRVCVSFSYTGGVGSYSASVDGQTWATGAGNNTYKTTDTAEFPVPPGKTYSVSGSGITLTNWAELR
jgi:hypothetical protein